MPIHNYGDIVVENHPAAWRKILPRNGAIGEVLGKTGSGDEAVDWIPSGVGVGMSISTGAVDPNGVVAGNSGDMYTQVSGGAALLWIKTTNGGNTGWV